MNLAVKQREELAARKWGGGGGGVIAVAKQLSLQFILTVLVFQFLEFFFYLNDTFSPGVGTVH